MFVVDKRGDILINVRYCRVVTATGNAESSIDPPGCDCLRCTLRIILANSKTLHCSLY